MSISMYQTCVPVLVRALTNLSNVLAKGAAHAAEKNIAPEVMLHTRITPDMFPLVRQVQIATDMAKGAAYRLAGKDVPKMEDNEATFDDLQKRIETVINMLKQFKAEDIDGSEDRDILLQMRTGDVHFRGQDYLMFFVLPNVYFHSTTAYAILRGAGVALGKTDYIGKP